jgi:LPS-assembly lipoprotein
MHINGPRFLSHPILNVSNFGQVKYLAQLKLSLNERRRSMRLVLAFTMALLAAGCFQPLYGDARVVPTAGVNGKLSAIEVTPIDIPNGTRVARVGVEIRNDLLFDLTGGNGQSPPLYRLDIKLVPHQVQVIVDINSGRPDIQNYGIDANYVLTEIATGKKLIGEQTFSRVSYNIPGQEQRFAGERGLRDAENRAAKVIAENIRNRLASFFVAGT